MLRTRKVDGQSSRPPGRRCEEPRGVLTRKCPAAAEQTISHSALGAFSRITCRALGWEPGEIYDSLTKGIDNDDFRRGISERALEVAIKSMARIWNAAKHSHAILGHRIDRAGAGRCVCRRTDTTNTARRQCPHRRS